MLHTLGGHTSVGVQIPRITITYKYITYKRAYIYVDACLYVALKRRRVYAEDTSIRAKVIHSDRMNALR